MNQFIRSVIAILCALFFALGIMVMSHAAFGQEKQTTYVLSEADRYHLQAIQAELRFEQLWLDNVITQFINGNPQVKSHNENAKKKDAELVALEEQLWTAAKLSRAEWELDIQTGQFVKKSTQ